MPSVREITEQSELDFLSCYATKSVNTKGREVKEEECELRTAFQRDRDRIIHSKSFRRLKEKTQVFLSPMSDHLRTRLSHTLEVSQIARTIARALRLNEDLTEAIALSHDLGHTPFGHAGERALDEIYSGAFTHFEQSVRVCRFLERNGEGLNLTAEVLDGILHHASGDFPSTPEGKIVRLSDHIAYINHDFEDAVRAGIISENDMPREITEKLGSVKSQRIDSLVKSVVYSSEGNDIRFDPETKKCYDLFHDFLYENVYHNPVAKREEQKVKGVMMGLYDHFMAHPELLEGEYALVLEREGKERAVIDYISGMTDHYAVTFYKDIYIPKSWHR